MRKPVPVKTAKPGWTCPVCHYKCPLAWRVCWGCGEMRPELKETTNAG